MFSGNIKLLELSPSKLKKKLVCSNHFGDNDFVNCVNKYRLKSTAVPRKWKSDSSSRESSPILSVRKPDRTYSVKPISEFLPVPSTSKGNISATPSAVSSDTETFLIDITNMPEISTRHQKQKRHSNKIPQNESHPIRKLTKTIEHQRKLLKNKRSLITQLRKTSNKYKDQSSITNVIGSSTFSSKYSKTLVEMQTLHKPKQPWKEEEKQFALLTYFKSPGAYKFWRNKLKIVLPSVSTLKTWIGDSVCAPGFNEKLLEEIQLKVSVMDEKEKFCTFIFDEIKIKTNLEYSKKMDLIEGYEDHGEGKRNNTLGTQIMVFMRNLFFLENAICLLRFRFFDAQ